MLCDVCWERMCCAMRRLHRSRGYKEASQSKGRYRARGPTTNVAGIRVGPADKSRGVATACPPLYAAAATLTRRCPRRTHVIFQETLGSARQRPTRASNNSLQGCEVKGWRLMWADPYLRACAENRTRKGGLIMARSKFLLSFDEY